MGTFQVLFSHSVLAMPQNNKFLTASVKENRFSSKLRNPGERTQIQPLTTSSGTTKPNFIQHEVDQ